MSLSSQALRRALAAVLAVATSAATLPAFAQQQSWHDGERRRTLWLDPAQEADFSAGGHEKSRVLRPAGTSTASKAVSPVFRDGPGEKSRPRALPGGVIVRVPAGTVDAARDALFGRHGLAPVRELGTGSGLWLVASDPGLPSLELANRLHASGDFAAASPNWWQPRTLK